MITATIPMPSPRRSREQLLDDRRGQLRAGDLEQEQAIGRVEFHGQERAAFRLGGDERLQSLADVGDLVESQADAAVDGLAIAQRVASDLAGVGDALAVLRACARAGDLRGVGDLDSGSAGRHGRPRGRLPRRRRVGGPPTAALPVIRSGTEKALRTRAQRLASDQSRR
jgi:hypothetical protein